MPLPQITWDHVQQVPDDGNRYEAIAGELYVTPAPSVHRQEISQRFPDLVVEILSPTTAGRDRGFKRVLYERQGVAE
jgi:Uma2 family endonuclease